MASMDASFAIQTPASIVDLEFLAIIISIKRLRLTYHEVTETPLI